MAHSVSVIVTTFERPENLKKVLHSLSLQSCDTRFEIIVADDGSTDHTQQVVEEFSRRVDFDVKFVANERNGFQAARTRNAGVAASTAPYLIFLDGDCVVRHNHISNHLAKRESRSAVVGYCCFLDEELAGKLSLEDIDRGVFANWAKKSDRKLLSKLDRKAFSYRLRKHPTKPKLLSGNFSISRADFERINGFDENFVGWGGEDDDFGYRLKKMGGRIKFAASKIPTFHLWHPISKSCPRNWRDGNNVSYLTRPIRLSRCANGLNKRDISELRILGSHKTLAAILQHVPFPSFDSSKQVENGWSDIEVKSGNSNKRFSKKVDCKILALQAGDTINLKMARQADIILSEESVPTQLRRKARKSFELPQILNELIQRSKNSPPLFAESKLPAMQPQTPLLDLAAQKLHAA